MQGASEDRELYQISYSNVNKGFFKGHKVSKKSMTTLAHFHLHIFIDLRKAFDTVDHNILLHKMRLYGLGNSSIRLMQSYLSSRLQVCNYQNKFSGAREIVCGVPQGSILGPLLFLLFVNDLPNCLSNSTPCLFADDTNLSLSGTDRADLELKANHELILINNWLEANRLHLNVAKTEFLLIGTRQRLALLNELPILKIGENIVKNVSTTKTLGVIVDQNLSWEDHIEHITKKVVSGLGAIKRIKPFVPENTLLYIYNALIRSHFDYCCEVWGCVGKVLKDKLQVLQNRAARLILGTDNRTSSHLVRGLLNWDNLEEMRNKRKALLMHQVFNKTAPERLVNLFSLLSNKTNYDLRGASHKFTFPLPKTECLKKSFSYNGAEVWNSLPLELREIQSFTSFKKKLLYSSTLF